MLTLKQAVNIVKLLREKDYNNEYDIYLDVPSEKIIIEQKNIEIESKLTYLI